METRKYWLPVVIQSPLRLFNTVLRTGLFKQTNLKFSDDEITENQIFHSGEYGATPRIHENPFQTTNSGTLYKIKNIVDL